MNVWDNFKKLTRPYAEEDDYDDGYDDYDQPAPRYESGRGAADDMSYDRGYTAPAANAAPAAPAFNARAVTAADVKAEISIANPSSIEEMDEIMNELLSGHVMALNMRETDVTLRRRIVDIVSGCIFAMHGSVTKVDEGIYMFAPKTVKVNNMQTGTTDDIENYI